MNWPELSKSFVTVVEAGGIRAAARKLGCTPMAVSKRIKLLEERVGQALFIRSTRNLVLTGFGESFLVQAQTLMSSQQAMLHWLDNASDQPQGKITLIALNEFIDLIVKYLPDFHQLYPRISLKIHGYNKSIDPTKDSFDLVFGTSEYLGRRQQGLVQRRLTTLSLDFWAADSYLDTYGTPESVEDLENHVFVTTTLNEPSNFVVIKGGTAKLGDVNKTDIHWVREAMVAANFDSQTKMAMQGMGIAQLPLQLPACRQAVRKGALIKILEEVTYHDFSSYIFYKKTDYPQPKIRAFLDFYIPKVQSELKI